MAINQVHQDILSQIFLFSLPEFPSPRPLPLATGSNQQQIRLPQATEPPLLLGQVCHRWRDVAHSTARLWAQLDVLIHTPDLQPVITAFSTWMARSSGCPLSISIACYTSTIDDLQPLLDVVIPHCRRWETLDLYAPRNILRPFLNAISGSESGLPMLRSLHVTTSEDPRPRSVPLDLPHLPQLVSASLRGGIKLDPTGRVTSSNLRVLHLDNHPNMLDFFLCLQSCQSIEELRASFSKSYKKPPNTLEITALPQLRKLHIGSHLDPLTVALNHLLLPSLQHLTLGPIPGWSIPPNWNHLSSMLKRSNADLTFLHFQLDRQYTPPFGEIITCLRLSPHLRYLAGYVFLWYYGVLGKAILTGSSQEERESLLERDGDAVSGNTNPLIPLLEEVLVTNLHDLTVEGQHGILSQISKVAESRCEWVGGGGEPFQVSEGAPAPQLQTRLARATFESNASFSDGLLNGPEVAKMRSIGVDVRFVRSPKGDSKRRQPS